jgi:threonylcarbamoyladenosine tRNA methylthiotransferase MtaB
MESLGRELAAIGHRVVASPEEADVCVVNTCAVTAEAARKSRQISRKLARSKPTARLTLTGCYATLAPEAVSQLPNVRLVVDNRHKDQLVELLQPWSAELDGEDWRRLVPDTPYPQPARTRAFVKVQDGCNNRCTFCIVTVARGRERSRPLTDIIAEIQQLVAEGFQEAVLTGVHLGGYGSDQGTDLAPLVAAILTDTDLPRLRLSSLEPWDLDPSFFELWQHSQGRLCPHLHLPLQSGCDRTLKRMARRNRTADFQTLVAQARAAIPGLTVTTDIICGFPGETAGDFAQSLHFVEAMRFAHVHVFPYSARLGTAAVRLPDQLPAEEKQRRVAAMQAVAQRAGEAERRQLLGTIRPVLWEKQASPVNSTNPTWSGLTDNYMRVLAPSPQEVDLTNRITSARLISVQGAIIRAELCKWSGS